ncbi:dipeptidase [Roseivirga misakiensis]|uniref:Peptidase n=1 Tax=Roseivirga misakiensis TaxID=1563681 RepID=A0A1E5T3N0_9BACT|nr:membrane dipeptidase [Roseivirga misakiensis]OEK05877.1 peptidase [Roseivirga misakiensis]
MSKFPIIDLHCDLLVYLLMNSNARADSRAFGAGLPFLKEGKVAMQVMAVYTAVEEASARNGLAQSALYKELFSDYSDSFYQATAGFKSRDEGIGIVASLESASGLCNEDEPLDNAFKNLETILENVERLFYISFTHHAENRFGGGNYATAGLKPDGEVLLEYMSGRQIAVDLSHTSDALAHDILDYTVKKSLDVPVLASHSNFRDIWDHPRNLTRENAQEIVDRGGLIGMNFLRAFLDNDRPEALLDHIKYGFELSGGENSMAFGADFFYTGDFPDPSRHPFYFPQHENAAKYQEILAELSNALTDAQKTKLAHQNVEQFIASNWK